MRSLSFHQRILIASGIVALGLGGTFALFSETPLPWPTAQNVGNQIRENGETLSPESLQRLSDPDLENLAQQHRPSLDRSRARFLLAQRLANSDPAGAQQWLEGLEAEYPVVAAEILSLRANLAAEQGQRETAQSLWQQILEKHSDTPLAAEALYALGETDPSYHDRLLAEWPAHPLAVELAITRLET
ncbi:MAG: tetratricopeptide repeat protein, partial [Prochlorotrichaceae cyanobacterium]